MSPLARAQGQAHLTGAWLRTVPRMEPKTNAPRWIAAAPARAPPHRRGDSQPVLRPENHRLPVRVTGHHCVWAPTPPIPLVGTRAGPGAQVEEVWEWGSCPQRGPRRLIVVSPDRSAGRCRSSARLPRGARAGICPDSGTAGRPATPHPLPGPTPRQPAPATHRPGSGRRGDRRGAAAQGALTGPRPRLPSSSSPGHQACGDSLPRWQMHPLELRRSAQGAPRGA